ncbi:hypothetical protein GIB67_036681 [Kingdonia uniflora]|uniref:Transposase MuDR plant domain-containing protein n=1 Tax=Kingdonia uniflora TaxID=39325 RepID=A0A7J7LWM8_9MAGN|nr:hypothetical protein GIB67_036681 [Kingdonia uniflora]
MKRWKKASGAYKPNQAFLAHPFDDDMKYDYNMIPSSPDLNQNILKMENAVNIVEDVESDSLNEVLGFGGDDDTQNLLRIGRRSVGSRPPSKGKQKRQNTSQVWNFFTELPVGDDGIKRCKYNYCQHTYLVKRRALQVVVELNNPCHNLIDYIGGENDKFKDVDGEYLCYMNLLNAITEVVDHKCGKAFCPAGTLALGTPRVMHGTLERDPNNIANLPRKKTLAKKTVSKNKAVRLGSVVGDVNMSQVMGDMTVSQVMGDVTLSQVMGDVTVESGYVGENVIFKKNARATKKYKRKNTETNGQNQPSLMKKKRLRPSELPEEELDHLPLFHVSDDDDNNMAEGLVENEWYDNTCIENEWYDNDMDEDNADEGGHDDDMGGDDANIGGDNDDEGGHDVDMGWDSEDIETQANQWIYSLDAEEGYYSTHSSQDGDGIPNEEDLRRCEVFGDFLNGANTIFEKEEDVFKPQPQTNYESLHVGMEWPTVSEAREYLRKFVILNKFETIQVKNESCRLRYKRAVKKCKWLVYARRSYDGHSMVLKGCHFEHTCTGKVGSENKLANALWITNEIEELVRDVKTLTPKDVQTIIRRKYGVNVSYYSAWNAKTICIARIIGSFDDGYNRLPELTRQVLSSNFGSIATWRQKGLIESVIEVFPHQNHIFCFRHMWKNFKKDFRGSHLERLCWGAAKAFVKTDKQVFLDKLQVDNPEAKRWLDKEPAKYWCRWEEVEVNLEERTCDYNEWYYSEYHMVSSYVKTYSGSVLAISDLSLWDKTVNIKVLPPPLVRGAGRPRKVRRKGDDKGGSQQKRCHKCRHLGHNKKTCKGPPAELRPKGSQPITRVTGGGRPRGNRPRDSFGTRSGFTSELSTQPTVPTPRGRGGRGTNVRGRGNSQTGRSESGITEAGRGKIAVVRGERGNTQAGRSNTAVVRGEEAILKLEEATLHL